MIEAEERDPNNFILDQNSPPQIVEQFESHVQSMKNTDNTDSSSSPSLRLIRSRAKLCTSSKRAWRFCTYSLRLDEGVSGGTKQQVTKGDEDLGQKASGMVNIRSLVNGAAVR
ncbi:hypothetical protein TNCV_2239441 [Trichonephila clavipes]|nr:hypothetical protein TNCV_2239441 [Trichonephila clavipes]